MNNSHLKMKNIVKAIVCAFFAFTVTVVNLPHYPVFSELKAQAQIIEKEKIDNNNIPACKLFLDLKNLTLVETLFALLIF